MCADSNYEQLQNLVLIRVLNHLLTSVFRQTAVFKAYAGYEALLLHKVRL